MVCVNLMDEAERKGIKINTEILSEKLGVAVTGVVAQKKKSLRSFAEKLDLIFETDSGQGTLVYYGEEIENAIEKIKPYVKRVCKGKLDSRWLSLRLLENDLPLIKEAEEYLGIKLENEKKLCTVVGTQRRILEEKGIDGEKIKDIIVLLWSANYI